MVYALVQGVDRPETRPQLNSPDDGARLLVPLMAEAEQEEMWVLLLNTKNAVLGEPVLVYRGTIEEVPVRLADLFRPAVRANAAAVLVAHNHPSGQPVPSPQDVTVTRAMVEAGQLLGVRVLDHLVIGRLGWKSLRAAGYGIAWGAA